MLFASGPYGDFDILSERGQKIDEPPEGEAARAIAHQQRYLRLFDAKNFCCLRLSQAALPDDFKDPQSEARLDEFLFRVWEAEVGENISGSDGPRGRP